MGFQVRWHWRIVSVVLLGASVAAQTAAVKPQVRVLVYVSGRIPATVVRAAGAETIRIFHAGGISLVWVNCSGRSSTGECELSADWNQFILHIVPKGKTSSDSVYGEAFLGQDEKGKYCDVFFDRIEYAHRDSGIDQAELLGAVAAHEIGHLLLGLHAHSWSGIMSPVWAREGLRQVSTGNLFFSREEIAHIKERMQRDDTTTSTLHAKANN